MEPITDPTMVREIRMMEMKRQEMPLYHLMGPRELTPYLISLKDPYEVFRRFLQPNVKDNPH